MLHSHTSKNELFSVRVDTSDPNVIYVGNAPAGSSESDPVWMIKKVSLVGGVKVYFAAGNTSFDQVWDNRASLSYS